MSTVSMPGAVVFAVILNFMSVAFWVFLLIFSFLFGNSAMTLLSQEATFKISMDVFHWISLLVYILIISMAIFHLVLAVLLLFRSKAAWYMQIVSLVAGFILFWVFPPCLIIAAALFIFFFMPNVRQYFGV